jgi:hypothetical protein
MIPSVRRLRIAWLVAISLMSIGSLAAHSLAYRLVEPDAGARAEALAGTGHGYLAYAPFLVASALAVVAAALAAAAVRGARGTPITAPSTWQLALLPPLGFALQEHLERIASGSGVGHLLAEPAFLVGLALQLPFALVALLAARELTRAAASLGRALTHAQPAPRRRAFSPAIPAGQTLMTLRPAAVRGRAVRGPPPRRVS